MPLPKLFHACPNFFTDRLGNLFSINQLGRHSFTPDLESCI